MSDDWQRWNTHLSATVEVELLGATFHLKQDPNSLNLGTTVWDSSIVFAKFIEKASRISLVIAPQNARRGEFSRQKLRGKRAVELGAGMGLCALAFAVMGADVLVTDLAPVLPLLRINCESNLSALVLDGLQGEVGKVKVQELDWYNEQHRQQALEMGPPDYILAADCIYKEEHVAAFRDTCLALMTAKSTLVVINELRSESVQSQFMELMAAHFSHKKVLHSRMGSAQHPAIDIYLFKKLKPAKQLV